MNVDRLRRFLTDRNIRFVALGSRGFFKWIPDDKYIKRMYKAKMGKELNLENPQTFTEKLQWLKIHDRKPIYTMMVDKFEAKKYVADTLGEQYIIPNYGVWNNFDDIDFKSLPDQFVLKCTHDSGGYIICKDKTHLNLVTAKKKINKCLKRNYYWKYREWPYKNVKPRIIAEKYIEDENSSELADYKVWCFNGEPKYIQYITGRNSKDAEEGFYNIKWEKQDFSFHNSLSSIVKSKPDCLQELLSLSRVLAIDTYFVRIDFYVPKDNTILFGEITFYPMEGMEHFHPEKVDDEFGKMINISAL